MLGCLGRRGVPFVVLAASQILGGCGGNSESHFDEPDGSAGGSTASSGGADGSGGTSTSGANTDGGATSGGGAANSSSTVAGSSGGSGGSGGATTSTTGAATTGSIENPVPPQELVDGCASVCELQVAADCPAGPTAPNCVDACRVITRVEACADSMTEFIECTEEDATTSCSASGEVVFDGCVGEQAAAYGCVYQEAPDPELEEPCETRCDSEAEAMCSDDFDRADCVLFCQSIGTILPACEPAWLSVLECSEGAEFECDEDGQAQPVGCDVEGVLFLACALPSLSQ